MASKTFEELALAKNPLYQRIIDMKAREEAQKAKKELNIKYVGCKEDKTTIELIFSATAKNLETGFAKISIGNSFSTSYYISRNGQTRITLSVPKNIIMGNMIARSMEYTATIVCDGLSAESEKFKADGILASDTTLCFCNRDFTVDELKNIVIQLRKEEIMTINGKAVPNTIKDEKGTPILKNGEKQFKDRTQYDEMGENIFYFKQTEKINDSEANFETFTKELNETFEKYDINTCIRKIHFLAQSYQETQRYTKTYETKPASTTGDDSDFRGRGLLQLTHNYNYYNFREYDKLGEKYKPLTEAEVKNILKDAEKHDDLKQFATRVAQEMSLACKSAGYFWKYLGVSNKGINQFADKDNVNIVSKEVNGYGCTTIKERTKYVDMLKKIMEYEKCSSKK